MALAKAKNGYRFASQTLEDERGCLIGIKQIGQYVGVCGATVAKYRQSDGFPVCKMPDGRYITTKLLISEWILARRAQELEQQGADTDNQEVRADT